MNKQKHERSLNDLKLQFEEGYRWLARNSDDWLFTFEDKPERAENGDWDTDWLIYHMAVESQVSEFYSSIKSSDENPVEIAVFLSQILHNNCDTKEIVMTNILFYARDKDGQLYSYIQRPIKSSDSWYSVRGCEFVDEDFISYEHIKWEDDTPTLINIATESDFPNNLFKLHYLEKKDMFIVTTPVYINKEAIATLRNQLEKQLISKVVVINGEFEYIKELHNLSS